MTIWPSVCISIERRLLAHEPLDISGKPAAPKKEDAAPKAKAKAKAKEAAEVKEEAASAPKGAKKRKQSDVSATSAASTSSSSSSGTDLTVDDDDDDYVDAPAATGPLDAPSQTPRPKALPAMGADALAALAADQ